MIRVACFIAVAVLCSLGVAEDLTPEQRLIVACHRLNVYQVTKLLRDGANVDTRFDSENTALFRDPWYGGIHMDASSWTPLLALANSSRYPSPSRRYENTVEHIHWATETQKKIPNDELEKRTQKRIAILHLLLSHGCDVNATDYHGATALYAALQKRHERFVRLLLLFKPELNTKTGTYIDSVHDSTPLHVASWSSELSQLLIQKGADDTARDGRGKTPADYRRVRSTPDTNPFRP